MPGSNHGPSIKDPKVYEALLKAGKSKQDAARISNAQYDKANGITPKSKGKKPAVKKTKTIKKARGKK